MKWLRCVLVLGFLLLASAQVNAQVIVRSVYYGPVAPAPVVPYYQPAAYYGVVTPPIVPYPAPVVPAIVTYPAPIVPYRPVLVSPGPTAVTYRTGLGIFRPRYTTVVYP